MVEAFELAGRERVLEVRGGHAHFVPLYARHGFAS
jgi:hypothetical protein